MAKVVLDETKCIGCGSCVACAGANFGFKEGEVIATVINETVTPEARDAAEGCPVNAIEIVEEETLQEAA